MPAGRSNTRHLRGAQPGRPTAASCSLPAPGVLHGEGRRCSVLQLAAPSPAEQLPPPPTPRPPAAACCPPSRPGAWAARPAVQRPVGRGAPSRLSLTCPFHRIDRCEPLRALFEARRLPPCVFAFGVRAARRAGRCALLFQPRLVRQEPPPPPPTGAFQSSCRSTRVCCLACH